MTDPAILSILHELRRRHDDREPPMSARAICERWNLAPADLDRIADAIETHIKGVDVLHRRSGGANGGATWAIEPLPLSTDPADGSGWSGRPGAALPPVPESGPYPPVAEKRPEGPYTATGTTRAADAVSEAIERPAPILSHADAVIRAEAAREDLSLTELEKRVREIGRRDGVEWAIQYIRDDIDDVDRPRTFLSGSPEDAFADALSDYAELWRFRDADGIWCELGKLLNAAGVAERDGDRVLTWQERIAVLAEKGRTDGLIDGSERLAATIHADLTEHGVPTHDGGRVMSLRERVGRIANNPTYQAIHKAVSAALDEIGIPPGVKDCDCADSAVRPCHWWKCRIRGVVKRADQVQAKHNAIDAHDQGVRETDNYVHKALDRLGVPRGSNRDGDGPLPWVDRLGLLAERVKESEDGAAHWKAKASGAESAGVDGWTWKDSENQSLSTYPAIQSDPRDDGDQHGAGMREVIDAIHKQLDDLGVDRGVDDRGYSPAHWSIRVGRLADRQKIPGPRDEEIARLRADLERFKPLLSVGVRLSEIVKAKIGVSVSENAEQWLAMIEADLATYKRADEIIQAALVTNTRPDPEWNAKRIVESRQRDSDELKRLHRVESNYIEADRELRRERAIVDALAKVVP